MKACIKLDKIIAEKLFGDRFDYHRKWKGYYRPWAEDPIAFEPCPRYSTDISAAWKVVDALLKIIPNQDIHMEHWNDGNGERNSGWQVSTCFETGEWKKWVRANTLPHAICLASLKAVKT